MGGALGTPAPLWGHKSAGGRAWHFRHSRPLGSVRGIVAYELFLGVVKIRQVKSFGLCKKPEWFPNSHGPDSLSRKQSP